MSRHGERCLAISLPPARGEHGIHQRARWFMHRHPACADMIRILPLDSSKQGPRLAEPGSLFWLKIAILTK